MRDQLIGNTYGRLTVIGGPLRKQKHTFWECKCSCGNVIWARGDRLKDGGSVSCGCKKQENLKNFSKDLTNLHFGKLTVLNKTDIRKDGRVVWECMCECGNICYIDSHKLLSGNTNSCGCLKSKGELTILSLLLNANIPFTQQQSFDTCRFPDTKYLAKFDFYVNDDYLIEFDGEQHFYYKDSPHTWNNELNYKRVKAHDEYKNQWCKENNKTLIRIPYTDIQTITLDDLLKTSRYVVT